MEGLAEVRLEVSSPGMERVFKSPAEYGIFKGRGIKVWLRGAADWLEGVNCGVQDGELSLNRGGRMQSIRLEDIVKAKLDPRS
jgi:ribosome maturation factor RimP